MLVTVLIHLKENTFYKEYQSATAKHLSLNSECVTAYYDDCFSVLSLARCRLYLEVLEFVSYIHTQRSECSKETLKTVYFVRLIKMCASLI